MNLSQKSKTKIKFKNTEIEYFFNKKTRNLEPTGEIIDIQNEINKNKSPSLKDMLIKYDMILPPQYLNQNNGKYIDTTIIENDINNIYNTINDKPDYYEYTKPIDNTAEENIKQKDKPEEIKEEINGN